jgi:hypothetical protein
VCTNGSNQLAEADPEPPQQILVFGYPRHLGTKLIDLQPLIRSGIVAMTSKEPFIRYSHDNSLADARMQVLDVRVFEGNSGGAVLRNTGPAGNQILLGLISAGDESLDVAYSEPVSRIREAIHHAHSQDLTPMQAEWKLVSTNQGR